MSHRNSKKKKYETRGQSLKLNGNRNALFVIPISSRNAPVPWLFYASLIITPCFFLFSYSSWRVKTANENYVLTQTIVTEIRPFWRVYFYVLACVRLSKSVLPHSHYTIRIAFRDWNSKTAPHTFRNTILRLLIRVRFVTEILRQPRLHFAKQFWDSWFVTKIPKLLWKTFDSFVSSRHEFILFLFVDIRGQKWGQKGGAPFVYTLCLMASFVC